MNESQAGLEQAARLGQLLPLRSLVVTLQFNDSSNPRFFHQPALSAMLRHLLGDADAFSQNLVIDAVESGRISYQRDAYYRFTLISLNGGEVALRKLMAKLLQLPKSAPQTGRSDSFGANLNWVSFHDAFTEQPIISFEELAIYDMEQLAQETALWSEHHHHFHWQWLTPSRLLKDKVQRDDATGEARFCADAIDLNPQLLLARLYDGTNALLRERGDQPLDQREDPPQLDSLASHCFWVDVSYRDTKGKDNVMGGLLGEFTLASQQPLPSPWAHLLVLGQYLGLGQRRSFGWGRYQLTTADDGVTYRRELAATSLLSLALTPENLADAFTHSRDKLGHNHQKTNDDKRALYKWECEAEHYQENPEPDASGDELPPTLERDAKRLAQGDYQAPDLKGVLINKTHGGIRALAIPPFIDRVLQRALAQILAPALDRVMDERSFGYRSGRSRHGATEQIQYAYRQGARWVVEADIDDFFDNVSHQMVQQQLRALFHQDPIIAAIINWLSAPVVYQGHRVERTSGLPQGSPISPLIANLLLDDFDADMRKANFTCIRYADDFVVLCNTKAEAEQALQLATSSLSEHDLQLEPSKTRITPFDRGFRFLGYMFVNDLALDVGSRHLPKASAKPQPSNGWLAQLLQKHPKINVEIDALKQQAQLDQPISVGERGSDGTLLCISGAPAMIATSDGRLHAERNGELIADIPWSGLRTILLLGRHHITTPAMHAALKQGVPMHLASQSGLYRGVICNNQPQCGPRLWLLQEQRASDPAACFIVAKELVNARIRHQQEVLRQRGWPGRDELGRSLSKLSHTHTLEGLLGVEGLAASHYFAVIAGQLDPEWEFNQRNRRPPKDPFNALLSLGYTLLYAHCQTVLQIDGLLPWTGFYHKSHGRHSALASDMMEPFRHLVERCALTMLNTRQLKPNDFYLTDDGSCMLSREARRLYLANLSGRFEQPLKGRDGETGNLVTQLSRQNQRLIKLIRANDTFTAWQQR